MPAVTGDGLARRRCPTGRRLGVPDGRLPAVVHRGRVRARACTPACRTASWWPRSPRTSRRRWWPSPQSTWRRGGAGRRAGGGRGDVARVGRVRRLGATTWRWRWRAGSRAAAETSRGGRLRAGARGRAGGTRWPTVVGDAVDVAVLADDPLGVADGAAVAFGAAGGRGHAVYGSLSSTGRNASLAVELTRLMTSCRGLARDGHVDQVVALRAVPGRRSCRCRSPGIPARRWPPASRRRRAAPFGVAALSTTSVPLDRSSPRPTLNWLCQLPGLNVLPPGSRSA